MTSGRNDAEDLDALLHSPGWHLVVTYARQYWTEQYEAHVERAMNIADDATAAGQLRQVIAAKKAVVALLEWPGERLRQLESAAKSRTPEPTESRRGTL